MEFTPAAQWIWSTGEESPRNFWLRLQRTFLCPAELQRATLLISADSRYELFVNGKWLGVGPQRAYPWLYSYDQYDITSWLHSGKENILAALVTHWGDHTFQYIRGRGGFLCELALELADGQVERIASDALWQVSPDQSFIRNTPRISIQQSFEEQYDARLSEEHWTTSSAASPVWEAAQVIGPVGTPPWTTLTPRVIPFLTHDTVMPSRVLAAELARPQPGYSWNFDLRHRYASAQIGIRAEAPETRGRAFATEIIAPRAGSVTLYSTHVYASPRFACQGQRIHNLPTTVELQEGRNLFVAVGIEWPSFIFATQEHLEFDATHLVPNATPDCAWAFLAPFDDRDETTEQILTATGASALPAVPRQPIPASENQIDISLLTSTQHFLLPPNGFCDASIDGPQPRQRLAEPYGPLVKNAVHLLHQESQFTTLYPLQDGREDTDIHLVIDFGREIIGYLTLELDAPVGAILDANLFEGIDESGIFWTSLLHNSFRYICREGYQTFRSHLRRGFRYVSLTIRNAKRPIRLHNVRCVLSTYPVEQRGRFACDDALLTKIWEVAAYTVQLCMEDTYTDCPAYEQTFWVGDARNSALVNAVTFGAYELTERCLRLTGQSLDRRLDSIKPPRLRDRAHLTTDHVVSGWFSQIPMWTFLWIWNVWEHYLLTGDRQTLLELYADVRECLQRCLVFLTERDLLDIPDVWNLVDWAAMDLTNSGEVTANNVLLVESLRQAALMADELAATGGDTVALQQEAAEYLEIAQRIKEAVNRYCWSEPRNAYVDTLRDEVAYERYAARTRTEARQPEPLEGFLARTRISEPTNTLALLCNCVPPERVARVETIVQAATRGEFVGSDPGRAPTWPADKIVPVGSPWFLFFTLEALLTLGEIEVAMKIIREQWGRMIEKGATTFWETFPGYTAAHWSRSLCHGWSAAPAYFLSTQVLGVQPAAPGYTRARIAPHRCGLRWAEGSIPTPRGDIYVRWSSTNDEWTIEIVLPSDMPGELHSDLPGIQPEYLSGTRGEHQLENGRWLILLPPGSRAKYRLTGK